MHRLIVVFLAVVDAAIAAAVGLAAILAPLTLVWILGFGGAAQWSALWPATGIIWQFGHAVPVAVTLPGEYLAQAGIDPSVASFTLSLAPLAFAAFTAIFAARSGRRSSQADAWATGVATSSLLFAAAATVVAVTTTTEIAGVELWQAILYPSLFFAVPATIGAVVTEWSEAGEGVIARVRDRVERARGGWADAPALIARGGAVAVVALVGLGAVATAVAVLLGGGEILALYESSHVDAFGATAITLAQLAYLPTLVVWAISFVAGPGFALGTGTSVSPVGSQVGVLPGFPVLGAVPESATPWLLLLALLPVAAGAFAGWIARSRLVEAEEAPVTLATRVRDAEADPARTAVLSGLLAASAEQRTVRADLAATAEIDPLDLDADATAEDVADDDEHDPIGARAAVAAGIAVVAGAATGVLAVLASGSIGPGAMADVGPEPGLLALVVGLETGVGAAILLLSPRRRGGTTSGRLRGARRADVSPVD